MATTLDLHCHGEASEDGRAPVEAYLNWIKLRRHERPLDGIVLTEHRQFNSAADYRALQDKFGIMVLKASEVETDYGHVLVFGVNDDILRRFDFSNVRLNAQELIDGVVEMGGMAVPCHPGRPNVGLSKHYEKKPPIENVVTFASPHEGTPLATTAQDLHASAFGSVFLGVLGALDESPGLPGPQANAAPARSPWSRGRWGA